MSLKTKMKLSVRVRGEWFAIPCDKGGQDVRWLGEEALRRYFKVINTIKKSWLTVKQRTIS